MDAVNGCVAFPAGDGAAADTPLHDAVFRDLGRVAYAPVWRAMQGFTDARDDAYAALQTWMTRFRRLVRPAFRDAPAVAARVGL